MSTKKAQKKEKKTVDKMSMSVNEINEKLTSLEKKVKERKDAQREKYSDRLAVMRSNPHYQALAREYSQRGALGAKSSSTADPITDSSYIADVVSSHIMHGTPLENLKTTAYVKALVDPERSGENAGVPDCVPMDTYRYQSIVELPIGPQYFDLNGNSVIVTAPDVVDHVMLPAPLDANEVYQFVNALTGGLARGTDLFDTNLIDPFDSVPVDTPEFRLHFPGDSDVNGDTIDIAPHILYGFTPFANMPFNFPPEWSFLYPADQANLAVAVNLTVPAISKTLNPARKRVYASAEATDNLRDESAWSIDSAATMVDKIMLPSQFTGSYDGVPHIVFPGWIEFGDTSPGRCENGFLPLARVAGTLTIRSLPVTPTIVPAFISTVLVIVLHGYRLGRSGGDLLADGHEIEIHYYVPLKNVSNNVQAPPVSTWGEGEYYVGPIHFDMNISPELFASGVAYPFLDGQGVTGAKGTVRMHDLTNNTWSDAYTGGIAFDSVSVGAGAYLVTFNAAENPSSLVFYPTVCQLQLNAMQVGFKVVTIPSTFGSVNVRGTPAGSLQWCPFQVGCVLGAFSVDQLSAFSSGLWTKYRPVSMSTWLTYVGGTLNDIGEVYGTFVSDHRYVADRDHNYLSPAGISSVANAYRGKAPLGAYGIWKPLSERDLMMRTLSSRWNFNRGFTVIAISSGTDTVAQNFVLRVVANFEVLTLAALYRESLHQSLIDHTQLWGAFQLLQNFPMVMANDEHQSAISNFFSSLWNGVKKAAGFVAKNIGPIGKIASTVGELAL